MESLSLIQVVKKFNTEKKCVKYYANIRWPNGVRCLSCDSGNTVYFETKGKTNKPRYLYNCRECHYQFSVTVGTIFHDSHVPLSKWFIAIYLICSSPKGISSNQLHKILQVNYKTAWYMAHRIRLAMQEDEGFCEKFSDVCEIDETFLGGKEKRKKTGERGSSKKVPVVGLKEKTSGKIRLKAIADVSKTVLSQFIRDNVKEKSKIHSDNFSSYRWLDSSEFTHRVVQHYKGYVNVAEDGERIHTNGVENVWSLFKRGLIGIYHKLSERYLPLYLDEFAFKFNNRSRVDMVDLVLRKTF